MHGFNQSTREARRLWILILVGSMMLAACGGGGSSSRPPPDMPPPSEPNTADVTVALTDVEVLTGGTPGVSATAELTVDLDDGAVTGSIELTGIEATSVALFEGFAGEASREIISLEEDSASSWSLPDGSSLGTGLLGALEAGGIHVKVTSADYPEGALRGQILLGNIQVFMTRLSGGYEIPPIDTAATGFSGTTFNPDDGSVIVHVQTEGLDDAVAGHVHQAFAGRSGAVIIELEQDPEDVTHWVSVTGAALDAPQTANLEEGSLYINIHTPEYPGGEARGQILPPNLEVVVTTLDGKQSAPPVDTQAYAAAGLTIDTTTSLIAVHVTAVGLDDATSAHIHAAYAGNNGDVAVGLEQDTEDPGHWMTADGTTLDSTQSEQFRSGQFYINIHTPAHPPGEVRGQIAPEGITVLTQVLSGNEEVPAVVTEASGTLGFTIDEVASTAQIHITTADLDDAVAAHVHAGFAGANGPVAIELEADPNDVAHWTGPMDTVLDESQLATLNQGGWYINVHSPTYPGGELRGQVLPDGIDVYRIAMTGGQSVPTVTTMATAQAAVTLDSQSAAFTVRINAIDLDDATAGHVHSGLAGATGPVVIELQQGAELEEWASPDGTILDETLWAAFVAGELYLNLHTPAYPAGEVRGQIVPKGIEVLFTTLAAEDVVPASGSMASGIAATTIDEMTHTVNINVNLVDLADATQVNVHQAPLGQEGPERFELTQNPSNIDQWSLAAQALDTSAYAALRNRGFYVQADSVGFPDGALRGQLEPQASAPPPATTFRVDAVAPANGAMLEAVASIDLTFNRSPLASSVIADQFELTASGGDGSFDDGNEDELDLGTPEVDGAVVMFDISGLALVEDTYRLTIDGEDLIDDTGVVLDGDNDGNPGGQFMSTFTIQETAPQPATFTEIQTEIFDVSCALSGCHSGGSPAGNMNLTSGQAYANIVGVPSSQNASFNRIEPNDPDNSYLVRKVEGNAGTRMPLGQPALSNDLIQSLRSWILDGAPDN